MSFLGFLKFSDEKFHPLKQRLAENYCCYRCHKKTLTEKHRCDDMRFLQCASCLSIYVLPVKAEEVK